MMESGASLCFELCVRSIGYVSFQGVRAVAACIGTHMSSAVRTDIVHTLRVAPHTQTLTLLMYSVAIYYNQFYLRISQNNLIRDWSVYHTIGKPVWR